MRKDMTLEEIKELVEILAWDSQDEAVDFNQAWAFMLKLGLIGDRIDIEIDHDPQVTVLV